MTRLPKIQPTGAVSVRNVSFSYGGANVLDSVSLDFSPGRVTGLSGRSGSGKSTLLYLLGLLLMPQAGSVSFGGINLTGLPDSVSARVRSEHVGFVFQDALLDPTNTVLGNVLEGCLYGHRGRREMEPRALDLIDRVGVSLRIHHKPGEVSGGQAQRVALCRALLHSPSVLLADEPTGNLDSDSASVVVSEIRRHAEEGHVVVVASHDARTLDACDSVFQLESLSANGDGQVAT